jgi:enoyl-CoA hydratase/carnithine racemase
MSTLFNYSTFKTELSRSTRTLTVTWLRPGEKNFFNLEMLFELESLLSWLITRVEIHSVVFTSGDDYFSPGIDPETLSHLSASQIEKIQGKLQKMVYAMMQLPQTIIMNLGAGASNFALEFSLGADIRIARRDTKLKFNHTQIGLTPASGGLSLLPFLIPTTFARTWLTSGMIIQNEQLLASGFIQYFYSSDNHESLLTELLSQVHLQAPIQRIQAKMGMFEAWRDLKEAQLIRESKISKAGLISEDWKKTENTDKDFMSAKSMSYAVKLSLVKDEPDTSH